MTRQFSSVWISFINFQYENKNKYDDDDDVDNVVE